MTATAVPPTQSPLWTDYVQPCGGDPAQLTTEADKILAAYGGRLFAGFRLAGSKG